MEGRVHLGLWFQREGELPADIATGATHCELTS